MKMNLFTVVFMLLSVTIFGQSFDFEKNQEFTRQLGLDASAFITRFISVNTQTVSSNTGLIFLYRKEKEGKNFRLALSPTIEFEKRTPGDSRSSFLRLNLKVGKEYYRDFGKRWRAYTGWDIGLLGFNSFTKFNNNNNVNRGLELSAGPIVGLQFRLSQRLSLSTEAFYDLAVSYTFQRNSNDDILETYNLSSGFSPLSFITLNYHF